MLIKDQIKFLKKTDGTNKVPVSDDGEQLYYLPSRKFIIPIDSAKVVSNGIVPKGMEGRVQKELRWEIPRGYVVKSELMIVDLLSNFNWDRPVYFAITVGDHNYMGLEKFFVLDGLAYRLVPFETKSHDGQTAEVNTEAMYNNFMKTFRWGNMNDPKVYLDETNMRMTMNFRNNFVRLSSALMMKGENKKAVECLDKAEELMPDNIVPYNYFSLLMADLYMNLGESGKAKQILTRLLERTDQEMKYYGSFPRNKRKAVEEDYRRAQLIAEQCNRMLMEVNSGVISPSELGGNQTVPVDTDSVKTK
jgi:hypothetical protein